MGIVKKTQYEELKKLYLLPAVDRVFDRQMRKVDEVAEKTLKEVSIG